MGTVNDGVTGFGALIIGDEIMRGKRQDVHFAKLREVFAARGLKLDWVEYHGDDRPHLIEVFRRTLASGKVVFSFGGIGATPDDHTRQAAAGGAGVALQLHPEAAQLIHERLTALGREVSPQQLEMGVFPEGSRIIPNPYNGIPGFSFRHHHFFPGFPAMAHPMLEWTLDKYYSALFHQHVEAEAAIIVWEGVEGVMTPLMQAVEIGFPGIKVFSLPVLPTAEKRRYVELGVRGEPAQVGPALLELQQGVAALGYSFEPLISS